MSSKDVHFLLNLRNQLKLYHWQTRVYARHVAVDGVLEKLDTLIDEYVEIYIGKYGRPKLAGADAVIRLHNLSEAGATKLVNAAIKYMMGPLVKGLNTGVDTDLINVRDEMVANLNQLLYLFTLR
jgi:phosphopantetheinyl transferase